MKKILLTASFTVLISIFYICSANAADYKIGVVDYQTIMAQSLAAQEARTVFYQEVEENNNKLLEKQKQAQALQDEINNRGKEMTTAELNEKTERLSREVKELNRMKNDYEEDLQNRETSLTQQLLSEIQAVVVEYSEKEDFTLILEKSSVVASSDAIDITDQIIRLYDATQ